MNEGIHIQGLRKSYGRGAEVLKGLDLKVEPGEVFGLIGPNGSGKTTLMSCLLGLVRWNEGSIEVDGLAPHEMDFKRKVGFLPERLQFDKWMTATHFMHFHHHLAQQEGGSRARAGECQALLEKVGLEQEAWNKPIRKYSRGMLQRVGLAQALVGKPKYLMLDEPTSGMDPTGSIQFRKIIEEFAAEGGTVFINSHQLEQVQKVCTHVGFVDNGIVRETSELKEGVHGWVLVLRLLEKADISNMKIEGVKIINGQGKKLKVKVSGEKAAAALVSALVKDKLNVCEVFRESSDLESLFEGGQKDA